MGLNIFSSIWKRRMGILEVENVDIIKEYKLKNEWNVRPFQELNFQGHSSSIMDFYAFMLLCY